MNDPDEHTLDEAWGEDPAVPDPALPDQALPTTAQAVRPPTTARTECNAEGCTRSASAGAVMLRVAPKGEIGPWACGEHVEAERAVWSP